MASKYRHSSKHTSGPCVIKTQVTTQRAEKPIDFEVKPGYKEFYVSLTMVLWSPANHVKNDPKNGPLGLGFFARSSTHGTGGSSHCAGLFGRGIEAQREQLHELVLLLSRIDFFLIARN